MSSGRHPACSSCSARGGRWTTTPRPTNCCEQEFDLAADPLRRARRWLDLEPALKPGIAGAWHYETDGHLRPDKLMSAWRRALEGAGVEIREHCELRGLVGDGRLVRRLTTNQGELPADQVVVATGAWTPLLATYPAKVRRHPARQGLLADDAAADAFARDIR